MSAVAVGQNAASSRGVAAVALACHRSPLAASALPLLWLRPRLGGSVGGAAVRHWTWRGTQPAGLGSLAARLDAFSALKPLGSLQLLCTLGTLVFLAPLDGRAFDRRVSPGALRSFRPSLCRLLSGPACTI